MQMANFAQKFVDIADKLAAVYGELKPPFQKPLSKTFLHSLSRKFKREEERIAHEH